MTATDYSGYRADADLGWRPVRQHWPRPGAVWRDFLLAPGSLTRRLQQLSDGQFSVRVLDEGWINGSLKGVAVFGEPRGRQWMWSRRVLLCGYGRPWVAAHSLIPVSSVGGSLRQLVRLRDRPLGGFLFRHPHLQRDEPELVCIDDHWGRRSVFRLEGKSLLVAEFFLPELIRHIEKRKHEHD